jgi:hypothetical protein
MNNFRAFLGSLCCAAENDHEVTMPKSKIKANRASKELSVTDEGLIIILELFKLELVP